MSKEQVFILGPHAEEDHLRIHATIIDVIVRYIYIIFEPKHVRYIDDDEDKTINDNDTYDKKIKGRTPPRGIGDTTTNSSSTT